MVLFAAGFNAYGQLTFDPGLVTDEPDDLFSFTKIFGAHRIERPMARLSYTQVLHDGQMSLAGVGPEDERIWEALETFAVAANGEILAVQDGLALSPEDAAQAEKRLVKYASLRALKAGETQRSWPLAGAVKTIAAFDAGFVILYRDGGVATLGDARYEDCLGREATAESPADEPGAVLDLADLGEPIMQVSAAGYTLAALTESGAVYLWGRPPHGTHRRRQALLTLNRVPNYVEIDGGKDVQDVAVGDSHVIALTTDGSIFVLGDNTNGQLGLGKNGIGEVQSWTKAPFHLPDGHEAVAVAAGPRSSFILTAARPGDLNSAGTRSAGETENIDK
ncbi:hypothetical protein CDD83_4083 [Cordyceps sp. RAO-2017]|nr:hypothetical protein CDD83_4083 [Cordyceps sp. RAO-2017]